MRGWVGRDDAFPGQVEVLLDQQAAHSLVLDLDSLPDCLEVTAWTETDQGESDEIMQAIQTPNLRIQYYAKRWAKELSKRLIYCE